MKERDEILITIGPAGYQATYTGPHAKAVQELFGTTTIPTAFTSQMAPTAVLYAIAQLNPDVTVRCDSAGEIVVYRTAAGIVAAIEQDPQLLNNMLEAIQGALN